MTQSDIKKIVENLIQTFLDAGKISIDLRKKGLTKEIKSDNTPVSNGDLEVNKILTEKIRSGSFKFKVRLEAKKPDDENVNESDNTRIFELAVGEGDLGKVIGKKGKNVNDLRIILSAATAKEGGKRAILEVIE